MMEHDEIDRILLKEDGIQPSGEFPAAVMAKVRQEAAVPPPIPFPWKLALPQLAAFVVSLVLLWSCTFSADLKFPVIDFRYKTHFASTVVCTLEASVEHIFTNSVFLWGSASLLLTWFLLVLPFPSGTKRI